MTAKMTGELIQGLILFHDEGSLGREVWDRVSEQVDDRLVGQIGDLIPGAVYWSLWPQITEVANRDR